ncbi:Nicotinamide-nucleotide amidase [hydrothermal vent metagenome]|uniref:Nicotinamide-nucleotide amidase n=1 Tax=hydrothermal vent metagenome TaxID=652676 RepID=A0A3B1AMI5_9ZZZZ
MSSTVKKDENCLKIEQLSHILINKGWYIACAESCTGGWVAKLFTDLAGSSNWFERGYVTYSNRAKQEMLGVLAKSLDDFGAVSEEVVKQMALGACQQAATEVSLAISGIAGPTGGSKEKPVGLVWFGWCINGQLQTHSEIFVGDRDAVRQQAVDVAIAKLLGFLSV